MKINKRKHIQPLIETVMTFFFLLDMPFSFWWGSCSSSSESESTFFFGAASAAVSSFFPFSCMESGNNLANYQRQRNRRKHQPDNYNFKYKNEHITSGPAISLKLNFSKTFLNSSSKSPSNSAFSGTYSTSTCSKGFLQGGKHKKSTSST